MSPIEAISIFLGIPAAVAVTIAIVVFARGPRRDYPRCGGCGYDVSGSLGSTDRCPECGRGFGAVGIRPAGAPRIPALLIAAIVAGSCVISGAGLAAVSMIARAEAARAQARQMAAQQAAIAQAMAAQSAALQAEADAQAEGTHRGQGAAVDASEDGERPAGASEAPRD